MREASPLPEIYVQPGEVWLTREPVVFRTILGSCVGIAFLAPKHSVGALCHPMLPLLPVRQGIKLTIEDARRYVDFAIRDVASQLAMLGVPRSDVRVKLFGGSDVLAVSMPRSRPTVGKMNCDSAVRVLEQEGFTVVARKLGGTSGLQLRFNTETGEVLLRHLR